MTMRGNWIFLALSTFLAGCGPRDAAWDSRFVLGDAFGLEGSVAVVDGARKELMFLSVPKAGTLETARFPMGETVKALAPSADGKRLFVLSEGKVPRVRAEDEAPSMRVFSGTTDPKLERTIELDDPMGALSLDPKGEFAVAFAGSASVTNPNELVFVDLSDKKSKPRPKTLRSFGGAPRGLVFTDELTVPEGPPRRFLVVRTDRDLALIDLSDLSKNEITVQLPKSAQGSRFVPEQVVFSDGDPENPADARLAVRLAGSADVVLLELGPPSTSSKEFSVRVNIVDVGGIPSTIDFVQTDAGLRLAALVPSRALATLVDPETTAAETVELGAPFSQMSRITSALSSRPASGDVALLWGGSAQRVAFWSLGSTSGTPYRSVDATDLGMPLTQVLDVGGNHGHLKVLLAEGSSRFFVLDLERRESFPLETRTGGYRVTAARDGGRLWATSPASSDVSMIDLDALHPTSLVPLERASMVFDLERGDGSRAALILHGAREGLSASLFDAFDPDPTEARYFPALHLRGLE